MRVMNRRTDFAKKFQTLNCRELVLVRVLCERLALYVLHNEVGKTIRSRAAIQELRYVRVIEACKNLSLVAKAAKHKIIIHALPDQLDGDLLFELIVIACGEIDCSHAALPDPANDFIRPDVRLLK